MSHSSSDFGHFDYTRILTAVKYYKGPATTVILYEVMVVKENTSTAVRKGYILLVKATFCYKHVVIYSCKCASLLLNIKNSAGGRFIPIPTYILFNSLSKFFLNTK